MSSVSPLGYRSEKVQEYLKVKGHIDSYTFFDHIRVSPHPGQRKIIDAYLEKVPPGPEAQALGLSFEYKYRTFVAACGRRFGKSFIVSGLAAEEMLYPNAQVLICSYRLENCKVIFRQVRELIVKMGIEIVADRKKELELELVNGARLCVASNDNVESRLGNSVSLLIIDEAKLFDRELFETFLEPQLLDYAPYSRTIMISSPQDNWLLEYYERGQAGLFGTDPRYADYWSLSLPSSTNPNNSREYLAKLKARIPPDIWEQEYEGKFVSAAGKVVKEFDRVANVFSEEDPAYENFWGWVRSNRHTHYHSVDSGYTHFFGSIYCMHVERLDQFFLFGEYQKNKLLTKQHAAAFETFEKDHGMDVSIRYADPQAAQQIADFGDYGFNFNKSEKNTRETIQALNTLFYQKSEITGAPRLMVHKDCAELIRQLATIRWKENQTGHALETAAGATKPFIPDDNKTDWDLFDATRYLIYNIVKNGRIDISVISTVTSADPDQDDDEQKFEEAMGQAGWVKLGGGSGGWDDDD